VVRSHLSPTGGRAPTGWTRGRARDPKRSFHELDADRPRALDRAASDRSGRDVADEPTYDAAAAAVAGDRDQGRAVADARCGDAVVLSGKIVHEERRHTDDVIAR